MKGGESWEQVKGDLNQRRGGQPTSQQQPPKADATPQPAEAEGNTVTAKTLGLSDAEFNALKRGKVDPALLSAVPASNRKALARNLMQSQGEADRAYQATRGGQQPAAADGQSPDDATSDPDLATGPEGADAKAETSTTARTDADSGPTQFGQTFALSDADYGTLADFGGEEFADGMKGVIGKMSQHAGQQHQQMTGLVGYLLERVEQADFDAGLGQLSATPGFAKLGDAEKQALRSQAELLVRSHQGPFGSFTLRDAVPQAAASLFQTNISQATQAQLLQRRGQSLLGSPDRGGQRPAANQRPPSEKDRMLNIGRLLQGGMTPEQARNAVDVA